MVAARRNAPITTTFGLLNALGYPAGTDEVSSDAQFRLRSARKVFGLLPGCGTLSARKQQTLRVFRTTGREWRAEEAEGRGAPGDAALPSPAVRTLLVLMQQTCHNRSDTRSFVVQDRGER